MSKKESIEDLLKIVLADTYSLYLQTQNFHWNLAGEDFYEFHKLFESQYEEYAEAIDELAENIRMIGAQAPGTFAAFSEISHLQQVDSASDIKTMIDILLSQSDLLVKNLHKLEKSSGASGMVTIQDLAVERLRAHAKHMWMLKSSK